MPETDENKTIDIDTSGPEVEVKLPEEKTKEEDKTYESSEDNIVTSDSSEESSQQPDVQAKDGGSVQPASEQGGDKQKDNRQEVEEYSEGVKKRIAKLTKKMREAERQREEALRYAESVKQERDQYKSQANTLDKNYVTEMEGRITSSIAAAQEKLRAARQNDDSKAETEALAAISQLGYEQGKLAELKTQHQMQETAAKEKPVEQPDLYQQPQKQTQTPPDPKAEEWAEKNEWFGKDSAMTYTAFDLHRKLTEEE